MFPRVFQLGAEQRTTVETRQSLITRRRIIVRSKTLRRPSALPAVPAPSRCNDNCENRSRRVDPWNSAGEQSSRPVLRYARTAAELVPIGPRNTLRYGHGQRLSAAETIVETVRECDCCLHCISRVRLQAQNLYRKQFYKLAGNPNCCHSGMDVSYFLCRGEKRRRKLKKKRNIVFADCHL